MKASMNKKEIEEHMNQMIKPEDIDRSHGFGNLKKSTKAKARPVTVKYVRYNAKNITYRNKKILKKGISVTESLTAKRIKILEKARDLHGFVNVWSQDAKIIVFHKTINKVNVVDN